MSLHTRSGRYVRHFGCVRGKHDDVIKWKHFPRYWPFVQGMHRSSVNSPHKGQWRGSWIFSMICARINGWVNTGEAWDLKRHRAHYDITVMWSITNRSYISVILSRSCMFLCGSKALIIGRKHIANVWHDDDMAWKGFPHYWLLWEEAVGNQW